MFLFSWFQRLIRSALSRLHEWIEAARSSHWFRRPNQGADATPLRVAEAGRPTNRLRHLVRVGLLAGLVIGTVTIGAVWFVRSRSPVVHWARAAAALKREDWPVAEVHLKNVIRFAPDDLPARLALADLYRRTARPGGNDKVNDNVYPPQAIEQLTEVARRDPKNEPVRWLLLQGHVQQGRHAAAVDIARELVELGSSNPGVLCLAANAAFDSRQLDDAAKLIELYGERVSRSSPGYLGLFVRLHEHRQNIQPLDKLLGRELRELSRKPTVFLEALNNSDFDGLGPILMGAVLYASTPKEAEQRLLMSLGVLESIAKTTHGAPRRVGLVDVAARLVAVAHAKSPPIETGGVGRPAPSDPTSKTRDEQKPMETHRLAWQRLLRLGEPLLKEKRATPFAYEQLAQAAAQLGDHARSLVILREGIELYRQLPAEHQSQVLALCQQAAIQLVAERRFRDAEPDIALLLANEKSAPLGHLFAGIIALEEGRWDEAQRHLSEVGKIQRLAVTATALLTRADLATRRWDEALKLLKDVDGKWERLTDLERLWLNQTQGGRDGNRLMRAVCQFQLGQSDSARKLLLQLDGGPLRTKARLLRVLDLLQHKQTKEARTLLSTARRDAPHEADLVLVEFGLLLSEKATDAAYGVLANYINQHPQEVSPRIAMARWLAQQRRFDQALQLLADTRQMAPDTVEIWTITADVLLASDRTAEFPVLMQAMRERAAVAHLVPLLEANWNLLHGSLDQATRALSEVSPELQRTNVFQLTTATLALARGNAGRAFELFGNSFSLPGVGPQVRGGFLLSFEQLVGTADPQKLAARVEELRKDHPAEPVVLLAAAELAARQGDLSTALTRIEQFEKQRPQLGRAAYLRARLLTLGKRPEQALGELQRLFQGQPQHRDGRLLAAQIEASRGQPAAALKQLEQLPSPGANSGEAALFRADLLTKLERTPEAVALLQDLATRESSAVAILQLASMLDSATHRETILKVIERGWTHFTGHSAMQDLLLSRLLRTGLVRQAEWVAQRFAGASPEETMCLRLAGVFLSADQAELAEPWIRQARGRSAKSPSDGLLFAEALLLEQRGLKTKNRQQFVQARTKYQELLARNPRHVPAMNNLAWLLVRQLKETKSAAIWAEQIREAVPDERLGPELIDTLVEVYRRTDRATEALKLLTTAQSRFPNSPLLCLQHGVLLFDMAGGTSDQKEVARQELVKARQLGLPKDRVAELDAVLARHRRK